MTKRKLFANIRLLNHPSSHKASKDKKTKIMSERPPVLDTIDPATAATIPAGEQGALFNSVEDTLGTHGLTGEQMDNMLLLGADTAETARQQAEDRKVGALPTRYQVDLRRLTTRTSEPDTDTEPEPEPAKKRVLTGADQINMTRLGSPDGTSSLQLTKEQQANMLKLGAPAGEPQPDPREEKPITSADRWAAYRAMPAGKRRFGITEEDKKALWGSDYNKFAKKTPAEKTKRPWPVHPISGLRLTERDDILKYYPDYYGAPEKPAVKAGEPAPAEAAKPKPFREPRMSEEELDVLWGRKKPASKDTKSGAVSDVSEPPKRLTGEDRDKLIKDLGYKADPPGTDWELASETDITAKEVSATVERLIPKLKDEDLQRMYEQLQENYPKAAKRVRRALAERAGTESVSKEALTDKKRAERVRNAARRAGRAVVLPFKPKPAAIEASRESAPADEQQLEEAA